MKIVSLRLFYRRGRRLKTQVKAHRYAVIRDED